MPTSTNTPPAEVTLSAREFGGVLRRRRLWVIAPLAAGLAAGAAFGVLSPNEYKAASAVEARAVTTDPFAKSGTGVYQTVSMPTEVEVATSASVAQRAADSLDYKGSLRELREGLTVSSVPLSLVLTFAYTSEDPERSAQVADAFADAYLATRDESNHAQINASIASLTAESDRLLAERAKASALGTPDGERMAAVIDAQLTSTQQQLSAIRGVDTRGGTVVQKAVVPTIPVGASTLALTLLGGGAGLVLGLALAFGVDATDRRVRSRSDVERSLGAPVLADVTSVPAANVIRDAADSSAADLLRSAALRIERLDGAAVNRGFLVTGVPSDGRSGTPSAWAAANLALALAETNRTVTLVSADLRQPSMHQIVGVDNATGLGSLAGSGAESIQGISRSVRLSADGRTVLTVVPSGPATDRPDQALTSTEVSAALAALAASPDSTVVAGPAALRGSGVLPLLDAFPHVVVVLARSTTREDLERVREIVTSGGGSIVGAIVVPDKLPMPAAPTKQALGGAAPAAQLPAPAPAADDAAAAARAKAGRRA